jgi:vanadium chloroperoxidase
VVGIREDDKSTGPAATPDKKITPPCDPFWKPLGAPRSNEPKPSFTPPFPAYPSGHATFGAATFEMVRLFYGHNNQKTEDPFGFTFVSDELDGKTTEGDGSVRTRHHRKYDSMAEAMYDNSVSRIFLGVHWRFDGTSGENVNKMLKANDNIGGVPLGRAIAKNILDTGMRQQATTPTPPSGSCI